MSNTSDIFGARTDRLEDGAKIISEAAESFRNQYETMYSIIDSLVTSEWTSPAATAIANSIHEQKQNLVDMYKVICGYADYCNRTANRVVDNEESIITGIGGGING